MSDATKAIPDLLKVFRVEDGATHWVAARTPADAIDMLAESIGENVEGYLHEYEPEVTEMEPHETISVRLDDYPIDRKHIHDIPERSAIIVKAETTAQQWIDHGKRMIFCSTEY